MMYTINQTKPYEIEKGASEKLADEWTEKLVERLGNKKSLSYGEIKRTYRDIIKSFAELPMNKVKKERVGIVGEIYVKFSPLANRNLENYLIEEGAEPVMAGLTDFAMFYLYGRVIEYDMYRIHKKSVHIMRPAFKILCKKQKDIIEAFREASDFIPPTEFTHVAKLGREYINYGVKMGEGWLLVAEMAEHIDSGIKSIVCTQPFGCLPNHIVGKGAMKAVKEKNPEVSIISVDYDASASEINQKNRIKLLLANAAADM